jgi:uncharacterized RDD family membrane protein YckC
LYCTRCGTEAVAGGNYCANCGHPHGAVAPVVAASEPVFAGFWLRVGAFLIDFGILVSIAYFGLMFASMLFLGATLGIAATPPENPFPAVAGFAAWLWLLAVAGPWLYHALFESSNRQATPGKLACGIKLTDLAGERIGFGRASARYFASWITSVTFLIGYLTVAFTERRQALHDLIARTLVVGSRVEPARVANAAPARKLSGWVVAMIAAGCSIVPLGILAAIAIPAYRDYTVRSQVSEGLQLAAGYKAGVQEFLEGHGRWPESAADLPERSSLEQAIAGSRYVESIEIWNGTIVIAFGRKANPRIRDHLVSLRPFVAGDGDLVWQCGNAVVDDEAALETKSAVETATDSDVGVTSVIDRYLPAACRSDFVPYREDDA